MAEDEQGELEGGVLVLQDLTEARRVDDMRREFVANVSHELKTPVAAIRALAETIALRGEKQCRHSKFISKPRCISASSFIWLTA